MIIRNDYKFLCFFLGEIVDVCWLDGVFGGGGGVICDCVGGVEVWYCLIVNVYVVICRLFLKNLIIYWLVENIFLDIFLKLFKGYVDWEFVRGILLYYV